MWVVCRSSRKASFVGASRGRSSRAASLVARSVEPRGVEDDEPSLLLPENRQQARLGEVGDRLPSAGVDVRRDLCGYLGRGRDAHPAASVEDCRETGRGDLTLGRVLAHRIASLTLALMLATISK